MSVYFDASILSSLFIADGFSERARAYVSQAAPTAIVSDFAAAEFASTVNKYLWMNSLTQPECRRALAAFDRWRGSTTAEGVTTADVAMADRYLRRLDLNLRTGDAIHFAIIARIGVSLATFDMRMADCAISLGIALAPA